MNETKYSFERPGNERERGKTRSNSCPTKHVTIFNKMTYQANSFQLNKLIFCISTLYFIKYLYDTLSFENAHKTPSYY